MAFIIVYITHPDKESARKISDKLIEEKLVACANIFPIESAYWWKGKVENEDEWVSIVKSLPEKYSAIIKSVEDMHSYDVPCIMKIEADANEAYEKWIKDTVSN